MAVGTGGGIPARTTRPGTALRSKSSRQHWTPSPDRLFDARVDVVRYLPGGYRLAGLAWLSPNHRFRHLRRRRSGHQSFVVGIILAASVSSASTFIINPGFIFVDGFSAYFHFVIAVAISFIAMLSVLSFRFRRIGAEKSALTIPDWIGKRYESRSFALFFSVLNLLSFAFIVLLVGGISIVMQSLLGISNAVALAVTLIFVTVNVFIGGTYAHVLTNLLQGSLMIIVTLAVLASCVWVGSATAGIDDRGVASDPLQTWSRRLMNWKTLQRCVLHLRFRICGRRHHRLPAAYPDEGPVR